MDRFVLNAISFKILLLLVLKQQCWCENILNTYNDYWHQGNYKYEHPLDYRVSQHESRMEHKTKLYEGQYNGEKLKEEENEDNFVSQQTELHQSHPKLLKPSSHDPNVISVARLGLVRGHHNFKIINGRQISAYLGLKYGFVKPGVGRFQKASSIELIEDLIDATNEPPNCPQFPDLKTIKERENQYENVDDCLTLNIYSPTKSGSYTVLVFVHGEMLFDGGAAEGQPDYFLENDVVFVTINYRLAPFGYFSTLTNDMPGNVALADIHMALEWIHQYIRGFNGNPDQVTLIGQSAGATLIHALSLSTKAEGLFHKLILQSGTALNPYFLDEQPLSTLRRFAHYAHCPLSQTSQGVLSCFDRMSTSDLLYYFKNYFDNNEFRGLQFVNGFKLILGDKLGYLPHHPAAMVINNTKPMIIGVAKDAGAFIMTRFYDQLVQLRSQNISDYINVVLKHVSKPRHYVLWKQWAMQHIFNAEDIENPQVNTLVQKLLELTNLILYRGPIIDSIRNTYKNYSTYMYSFDYRGEYHRFGHLQNPFPFEIDATLSDDNIFLFPFPDEVSQLNPEDKTTAKVMVNMWVNFAISGTPTLKTDIWPRVSSEYGPFIRFTNMQGNKLELDYHFCEGIPVPYLYPEFSNITKGNGADIKNSASTASYRPNSHFQSRLR